MNGFDAFLIPNAHIFISRPISLGCGHTVCKLCLGKLHHKKCQFDQSLITRDVDTLPVNFALLQLVGVAVPDEPLSSPGLTEHAEYYLSAKKCIEELAILLKPTSVSPGVFTILRILIRYLWSTSSNKFRVNNR